MPRGVYKRTKQTYGSLDSKTIRDMRRRLPKCWKYIDWALSSSCTNPAIKRDVVNLLMGKALPNKIEQTGDTQQNVINIIRPNEGKPREDNALATRGVHPPETPSLPPPVYINDKKGPSGDAT